jgi:hypothetical protein
VRVELDLDHWVIVRGVGHRQQFYDFLIDHDRSAWTSKKYFGHHFMTIEDAQKSLAELSRRARLRKALRSGRVA